MDKSQAVHSFWNSYGIPAYDQTIVPDDAEYPYITYSVVTDSMDYIVMMNASIWYRSTSWAECSNKADEISASLNGGKVITLDRGYLYLYRGTPFAQRMADESDELIRRIYINLNGEYLTDK